MPACLRRQSGRPVPKASNFILSPLREEDKVGSPNWVIRDTRLSTATNTTGSQRTSRVWVSRQPSRGGDRVAVTRDLATRKPARFSGRTGGRSLVVLDRQSAGGDAGRVESLGKIGICLLGEIFPHVVGDDPFGTARTGTKHRRIKRTVCALDDCKAAHIETLLKVVVYGRGELRPGLCGDHPFGAAAEPEGGGIQHHTILDRRSNCGYVQALLEVIIHRGGELRPGL